MEEIENKTHNNNPLSYIAIGSAALAILIALASYQNISTLTQKLYDQNTAIAGLARELSELQESTKGHHTDIAKLNTITAKLPGNHEQASFAIEMSIYELELLRNYDKAIEYLQLALSYIHDGDIAKQITSAISTLKQVPRYDLRNTLRKLDSIQAKLLGIDKASKDNNKEKTLLKDNKAFSFLNKFVTVSYSDSSLPQPLSSKQQYLLETNILLAINQIKAALVSKDSALFNSSTVKLQSLLASHFAQSAQMKAIQKELQELQSFELNPKTPDLTPILHAISNSSQTNIKPEDSANNEKQKTIAKSPKQNDSPKREPSLQTNSPHVTEEF